MLAKALHRRKAGGDYAVIRWPSRHEQNRRRRNVTGKVEMAAEIRAVYNPGNCQENRANRSGFQPTNLE
jgi:hypothetical protein